jgi:superfamily II DNA helicase RecQ
MIVIQLKTIESIELPKSFERDNLLYKKEDREQYHNTHLATLNMGKKKRENGLGYLASFVSFKQLPN